VAAACGTKSALLLFMPPTPSPQRPLIDDSQFFAELERFAHVAERPADPAIDVRTTPYADAFDALESGLPVNARKGAIAAPHHERPPINAAPHATVPSAPPETRVTAAMAAVVLVACLTAGAATAAYVFHDRVERITAPGMATR
jgi:hypothetical protein